METIRTKYLFPCLGAARLRSRVLPTFIAVLNLLSAGQAPAQTFTCLGNHNGSYDNFNDSNDSPFFLGNTLYASLHQLVLSGNTFYCVAPGGDEADYSGALYAVSTDGTGFTWLYNFTPYSHYASPFYVNADGAFPNAPLILSGATLYGTAYRGGAPAAGTVFAVSTNGTGFTVLFTSYGYPQAGLILSGNTLYGTASGGPYGGLGAVFAVNTNGTGFTNLYYFTGRSDGAGPQAGLLLSGNTLYGTSRGDSSNAGTVFALKTNGTGFTILHSFAALDPNTGTNSDGANPTAGLMLLGNTLYGTASGGGSSGNGTVFSVRTNGTGFTNLHSFTAIDPDTGTNSDGAVPLCPISYTGQHLVWNDVSRRQFVSRQQFGRWHAVQHFVRAATDHRSFRNHGHFVLADQRRRVRLHGLHIAIHHQRGFNRDLEHQFNRAGRRRRTEHRHQSHHRRPAILPPGTIKRTVKICLCTSLKKTLLCHRRGRPTVHSVEPNNIRNIRVKT